MAVAIDNRLQILEQVRDLSTGRFVSGASPLALVRPHGSLHVQTARAMPVSHSRRPNSLDSNDTQRCLNDAKHRPLCWSGRALSSTVTVVQLVRASGSDAYGSRAVKNDVRQEKQEAMKAMKEHNASYWLTQVFASISAHILRTRASPACSCTHCTVRPVGAGGQTN